MKFTLSWLKDHLDTTATIDEICEGLIGLGLAALIAYMTRNTPDGANNPPPGVQFPPPEIPESDSL